ncbi:MAG TPA: glycosyltransferase family 4 protein [Candidatus Glassbacteria bacterium]|nr:glycosyltransferase family 4 protein [Candidatus Glassbacteria bacterium]
MPYRILLINWRDIQHPEAGGAEVHAHEIFRRLASRGHEVTFLTCAWPGCEPRAQIDGIRVVRGGKNATFNYAVPRLAGALEFEKNFDIVVEDLNKIPLLTPRFVRIPRLILVHHLFGATIFREAVFPVAAYVWLWEQLIPFFYKREWVQSVSQDTTDELAAKGFSREKIRIVYNGIDCSRYTPGPAEARADGEERYLLYMGRIKRYKRLDLILEAFQRAGRMGLPADIRLVFAGAGDDYPRLQKRAEKLAITGRTSFRGRVSEEEKINLLRGAVCVVNPSPKEGWGITNMEAAACGTPVVASRSPGLRESVRDGRTGFLFTPGDVAQFSARIVQVAADQRLRIRLSAEARRFAETLTWNESAQRTEQYISHIIESWEQKNAT